MNLKKIAALFKQKQTQLHKYKEIRQLKPQSIINGLLGDKSIGPLTLKMNFFTDNKPIDLTNSEKKISFKNPDNPKVCLLIHGLMDGHHSWRQKNDYDYGDLLSENFGYTPLYLRYNTGLHISQNGRRLAKLIRKLEKSFSRPVDEIIVIAHSMGGLVMRSACHYGGQQGWLKKISQIFYLGCPHLGAPLEKFGNLATNILTILPYPFLNLTKNIINLRSAGIKDLRHGYLVDEDWQGTNPDSLFVKNKAIIPLHPNMAHFAISSSISKNPHGLLTKIVGDSMVPPASAFGQSKNPKKNLYFYPDHLKLITDLSHVGLIGSDEVYKAITEWLIRNQIEPPKKGAQPVNGKVSS